MRAATTCLAVGSCFDRPLNPSLSGYQEIVVPITNGIPGTPPAVSGDLLG